MKLIVGLGNPGEKYEKTRHNFGFAVVDKFLKDFETVEKSVWSASAKLKSDIAIVDWQPKAGKLEKVILAKPQTYMNNSGMGVSLVANFYKVQPEDVWLVYDELDLPLGTMKIRFGGAAAGHHGVESVIEHLGTDKFWRFRMGIGESRSHTGRQAKEDDEEISIARQLVKHAEDYVLASFGSSDQGKVRELLKHGSDALQLALEKGLDEARNKFNTK